MSEKQCPSKAGHGLSTPGPSPSCIGRRRVHILRQFKIALPHLLDEVPGDTAEMEGDVEGDSTVLLYIRLHHLRMAGLSLRVWKTDA